MKELDRIKQEVAIEFSAGNYESFEQAVKVYDAVRMINEVCKRYAQLVGENALKEAAENVEFLTIERELPYDPSENYHFTAKRPTELVKLIDKSSITNPKNVKLL